MDNKNCWEYFDCGREPGGRNIEKSGVCAVFDNDRLDGINHGKFGGRICWGVAGTLCPGEVEGVKAKNIDSCMHCDFYLKIKKEEAHPHFKIIPPKTI